MLLVSSVSLSPLCILTRVGLRSTAAPPAAAPPRTQADDSAWLQDAATKAHEALSVRLDALRQHHPKLLQEAEARDQQDAVVRAARRQHGPKAAALAKAATAKGQMTLTSMFRVTRKETPAPATPGGARVAAESTSDAEEASAAPVVREVIDLCTPEKQEHRSPAKKAKTPRGGGSKNF